MLTLLPGAPLPGTVILSDEQLRSSAGLLRTYHDAAASAPDDLRHGCETVVHGDAGPWNILWQGATAAALIDFDEARPGEPLLDLGYFAWKGLRLSASGPSVAEQERRLALLADAYGVPVDAALSAAIERAYCSMVEKGEAEHWPLTTIKEIQAERAWYRQSFPGTDRRA
jgi:aminoglycoside phosphotransferase (APT) family kinase protein